VNAGDLVGKHERVLLGWGTWALVAILAGRVAFGWFTAHQIWLLDSQLLAIPLLIALAVIVGLSVRGGYSAPLAALFGLAAWIMALTLIPRSLWWQAEGLRADLPDWLAYSGLVLLVLALIARAVMTRRWLGQVKGHGYQWILDWAAGKPYFARLLALRVLHGLGYWG